jgi:hypothetical protein
MPLPLSFQATPGAAYQPTGAMGATAPRLSPVRPIAPAAPPTAVAGSLGGGKQQALQQAMQQKLENDRMAQAEKLREMYARYLGRELDPESLKAHLANPKGMQGAMDTIMNSPEAQAYRQRQGAQPPQAAQLPVTAGPQQPTMVSKDQYNQMRPQPTMVSKDQYNQMRPQPTMVSKDEYNRRLQLARQQGQQPVVMNPGSPFRYRVSRG